MHGRRIAMVPQKQVAEMDELARLEVSRLHVSTIATPEAWPPKKVGCIDVLECYGNNDNKQHSDL